MKQVGNWWSDSSIELVEVDGVVYALNGWDGEKYAHCWICTGDGYTDASDEEYVLRPVKEPVFDEDEPSREPEDALYWETVDYEVLDC